jgi:hypothetical protein
MPSMVAIRRKYLISRILLVKNLARAQGKRSMKSEPEDEDENEEDGGKED